MFHQLLLKGKEVVGTNLLAAMLLGLKHGLNRAQGRARELMSKAVEFLAVLLQRDGILGSHKRKSSCQLTCVRKCNLDPGRPWVCGNQWMEIVQVLDNQEGCKRVRYQQRLTRPIANKAGKGA